MDRIDVARVWVGDRLVEPGKAVVSALDHGLTVGDGVFETCAVRSGVPFALTRHLRRLDASATALGLEAPDHGLVREAVAAVLDLPAEDPVATRGRLRITWTAGPGPLGSARTPGEGTLVVAASAAPAATGPAAVATVAWPRNERGALVGVKSTSYGENVVALAAARHVGATEALLPNTRGELCEGTGSNVVVVVDGELLTPPLASGCLAGITRELLLEWSAQHGRPVREVTLPFDVVASCEEVLLTSSARDVQAVGRVDDRDLTPGPIGRGAIEMFARQAALDIDP